MSRNPPKRKVVVTLDTYLSILAVVSSFCAIGITFYQAYLQRTQQYASVIPILESYNTSQLPDGGKGYAIIIANNGLGPAFIEDVSFEYKEKLYTSVGEMERAILNPANLKDSTSMTSDLWKGRVIPQGERFALIQTFDKRVEQFIRNNLENVQIKIIYRSVYGEKWKHQFPPNGIGDRNTKVE
ncbi:hypothetical protein DYU11_19105 [Fibrisoma montanum]|uniref:Uncharacterized protein n=1 Tax=Fibrisoma montanum TaxID=2305895 RepID=A0A418M6M0_9BACT|nr:hypothetical protein [Fibrisoma montanum]RIV21512.1 hypothetical protein DYU11_19105 [Fibrisoma montanum]